MTLLDIHGQPKSIKGLGLRAEGLGRGFESLQSGSHAMTKHFMAVFEGALENPVLPALFCGLAFHILRFCIHVFMYGTPAGFLPTRPPHYLAWLPEFLLPYVALSLLAAGHRKNNRPVPRQP